MGPSITVIYPHRTHFKTLQRCDLLSDGFQHPETLVDVAKFLMIDLLIQADDPTIAAAGQLGRDRNVLVLKHESDKKLLTLPLGVVTAVTLAISIAIGLVEHSVEVGASIFGGVLASMAVLVAYLKWLLK